MDLREQVIAEIRKIYDPEIPVNIYELGLIYDVKVKEAKAKIIMTLTTPNCPEAQTIPEKIADVISLVKGVNEVKVEITWDPPWTQEKMTEAARLELGLM